METTSRNCTKLASNVLLGVGGLLSLLAIMFVAGPFQRLGLSAEPPAIDLGELGPGETVPVTLHLRNNSSKPVCIIGARYAP